MEDSTPIAPTPRTPITHPTVVELYENHYHQSTQQHLNNRQHNSSPIIMAEQQQQQQQETSKNSINHHHHQQSSSSLVRNNNNEKIEVDDSCQEYEDMIKENRVTTRRDALSRRITDYTLRLIPMLSLILYPVFILWSGFNAPSLFFISCLCYLSYNVYLLGHNFYYGRIGIKRAKVLRFVDFYQKYLMKQRNFVQQQQQAKSKSLLVSYGGNSSNSINSNSSLSSNTITASSAAIGIPSTCSLPSLIQSSGNQAKNSSSTNDMQHCSSSSDEDSQFPQSNSSSSSSSSSSGGGSSTASRFKRMRPNRSTTAQLLSNRDDTVWNRVTHFVIIPNFNERESILRQSLNSLAQQKMARRQIIPVLAMEAREQFVEAKAKKLVNDYILQFKDMLFTVHPSGLPDESPGKGSNSNFAWNNGIKEYIQHRSMAELDSNYAVVTVQDADSIYHENHFDSLTYSYLSSHLKGTNNVSIWQSPMVCYRNFNEIPAMSRMISFVITMHEMAALNDKNYEKISFSTYSMSHNFLLANNGWCTKYITEDWHCTVRTFFNTGGRTRVHRLPFPISCYSTQGETYYESLYERYIQGKRHSLALTEITYIIKRMILTWKNGSSIPDYVKRRFHKLDSKCIEGSAEEYEEEDVQNLQIPVNWTRIFKLFWNLTSVQFIGGTQLTMLIASFLFSQYYSWLYTNAEITDEIYRVNHIWTPLLNLANLCLFSVILSNVYLNGQLITLVNGREYQHKYYWIVHFIEWWIFSFPGTLFFNLIPTHIAAYRILFEEKFFFERSIKPEAPQIYRKKKTVATPMRKNRRISANGNTNTLLSIAPLSSLSSPMLETKNNSSEDYVIDVSSALSNNGNIILPRKKNANRLSVDVVDSMMMQHREGTTCHGRSDSSCSSTLSVSNSCSEDEYTRGTFSDSSVDPLSPLTVLTGVHNNNNNLGSEKNIFQQNGVVGNDGTPSNVVTHITAATSRSKSTSVTVR